MVDCGELEWRQRQRLFHLAKHAPYFERIQDRLAEVGEAGNDGVDEFNQVAMVAEKEPESGGN